MLELYTRHQRMEAEFPGTTRQETPYVVRHAHAEGVTIAWSRVSSANADEVIRAEVAAFEQTGLPELEWKWFDSDAPADLFDRLVVHGFAAGEAETVMVAETASVAGPPLVDVRLAEDAADVLSILDEVWPGHWSLEAIRAHMEATRFYVAWVDGVPASAARLELTPGSPFAGLFGGTTRSAFRRRGLYTALVRARAQDALLRGVPYLTVDALPTSRPILEKLGFRPLCVTVPMVRTAAASAPDKSD